MTEPNQDKRLFTRVNFNAVGRVLSQDQFWPVKVLDLSLKGALLQLQTPWNGDLNQPLILEFVLPNSSIVIRMQAKIAHLHHNNMGLVCKGIDLESVSHLKRLVELNLGSTELLERELTHLSSQG